jgi:hypothetical protein
MKSNSERTLEELIVAVTEEVLSDVDDEERAHYVIACALLRDLLGDGPDWLKKLNANH